MKKGCSFESQHVIPQASRQQKRKTIRILITTTACRGFQTLVEK